LRTLWPTLPTASRSPRSGVQPVRPPRAPGSVVDRGAVVRGVARWWSGIDAARRWRRRIHHVDFLVDGRRLWADRVWPFAFRGGAGWDTRTVGNGRHLLVVRAYGRRGYRIRKLVPVRVANPPLRVRVAGAAPGAALHGIARLGVRTGERTRRVVLWVDGRPVSRDDTAPFRLCWDTTAAAEGTHRLAVTARTAGGRRGSARLDVVVANADSLPVSLRAAWGRPVDGWPAAAG
jgi:Big-like domain-containing protein